MSVRNRSARSRGGRLQGGAAAGLIAAGAAVLWFGACRHHGPPRPDPRAARPGAAAAPSAGAALGGSIPLRVDIPRVGIHSRLLRLGLEHDGSLAVPPLSRAQLAGWYDKSPTPGERGPAVLVGHVDTKKGPAVFYGLARLHPGDKVEVTRADDTVAIFAVDSVERASKKHFPTQRVYGPLKFAGLRLITCGGDFDGHSYKDNTIVFAHLTGRRPVRPDGSGSPGPADGAGSVSRSP
ncbi:class F sortase [Actinoallomurus soli]|uniref:class F sortase n=1 Tax=Actinoallomurus soli TaxID=2952535 RepID=UPI0020922569|nr:class F sortase [Actinoallomurus soli]MCO5971456.1 class F sortase [Actinoallomurus soli]